MKDALFLVVQCTMKYKFGPSIKIKFKLVSYLETVFISYIHLIVLSLPCLNGQKCPLLHRTPPPPKKKIKRVENMRPKNSYKVMKITAVFAVQDHMYLVHTGNVWCLNSKFLQ